jgi:hypothetical protein
MHNTSASYLDLVICLNPVVTTLAIRSFNNETNGLSEASETSSNLESNSNTNMRTESIVSPVSSDNVSPADNDPNIPLETCHAQDPACSNSLINPASTCDSDDEKCVGSLPTCESQDASCTDTPCNPDDNDDDCPSQGESRCNEGDAIKRDNGYSSLPDKI